MLSFLFVALAIGMLLAAFVALDAPRAPKTMPSVANAFADVDFSDLPAPRTYTARDGSRLLYRSYPGDPRRIVIAIHGSSGTTTSMHAVARAIHRRGATVHVLAMRGHEGTGRSGDIDYIGQLEDDVIDFIRALGDGLSGQRRTLLGFSSGGGFALRFAGKEEGNYFDRLILVAPQFPHYAPTSRPAAGGWVSVATRRIIVLSLLSRIGLKVLGSLPVLAMAVDPVRAAETKQTPVYSFRMQQNFCAADSYLQDVKRFRGEIRLFVGGADEIFRADQYAPLLHPVRPDLLVTVIPGVSHMAMTAAPTAVEAIAAAA